MINRFFSVWRLVSNKTWKMLVPYESNRLKNISDRKAEFNRLKLKDLKKAVAASNAGPSKPRKKAEKSPEKKEPRKSARNLTRKSYKEFFEISEKKSLLRKSERISKHQNYKESSSDEDYTGMHWWTCENICYAKKKGFKFWLTYTYK